MATPEISGFSLPDPCGLDALIHSKKPPQKSSAMKSKKYPHVALLVETSNAYSRLLLQGVADYIQGHGPWSIYLGEKKRGDPVPAWLSRWDGDGIIARVENEKMAESIMHSKMPAVNVSQTDFDPRLPSVNTDEFAVAQMSVEHLINRGFRQLAYCSVTGFSWAKLRQKAFVDAAKEAGFSCHVYEPAANRRMSWEREQEELAKWLQSLPKPIGMRAAYDFRGQQVLDACRRVGLAVPEAIAVIGAGNDEVLCRLAWPPMTSTDPNPIVIGYEAAALLDRLMQGEPMNGQRVLVQPLSIAARQSTDTMAIEDKDIADAVRLIRESACEGINVGDVLSRVPLVRQSFEQRFKKALGRSPHAEIVRVRLERAKQLLTNTDLPLSVVAEKAGFSQAAYLSTVFKEKVGKSPSNYRTAARVSAK